MRFQKFSCAAAGITAALAAFGSIPVHGKDSDILYRAELLPLNTDVTGSKATGEVIFEVSGDQLTIRVIADEVPPDVEHLQHFHGFPEGSRAASCPTGRADANGDGIIDLIETEPLAGTTMVPFHDDPVSMEIVKDTYPVAGVSGSYSYAKTLSLKALQDSFGPKFGGQELDLGKRVVFLHGVPDSTMLPPTVASLGNIPAQVTLPIACGEIKRVES